jgi:8-oxo-dGTP pyrophosphatase MutT (NUDIX family)
MGAIELVKLSEQNFRNWKDSTETFRSYSTNWFSIFVNHDFHVLDYSTNQVVILPIVNKSEIILVKARRPVIGSSTWELPAGGLEHGETEEEGALRELKEETGVLIEGKKRLRPMNSLVVSPTRMPMFPSLFSINITREEFERRKSQDNEIEEVGLFSLMEIRQMILNEEIFVSLPLAILSRFLLSQDR